MRGSLLCSRATFLLLTIAIGARAATVDLRLIDAVRNRDVASVRVLLQQRSPTLDVNAADADGSTALHWAAHRDDLASADLLIRAGARVNAANDGGATPLLFAVRAGDAESARLLLKAGADANDAQPDGVSALVLAAHSGHGDVGMLLLDAGADPNAIGSGYAALHAAVLRSDLTLVSALVAHRADPNLRMTRGTPMRRDTTDWNLPKTLIGSTPYLLAAKFLEPEILQALAAGGADRAATMPDGADALMLATGMGSGRTASRRGIETIDFGKVEPESRVRETVAAVLALGGRVTAASQNGDTALHVASALGYDTVVQMLVDHGAEVGAKNKRGVTPVVAAMFGSTAGARGSAAPAGADSLGFEPPIELAHPTTVALLKKIER